MVQIDIPMPRSCADCPLFNAYDFDIGYCGKTTSLIPMNTFDEKRLNDCPLKEVKDEETSKQCVRK